MAVSFGRRNLARLRQYRQRAAARGVPAARALLVDLPVVTTMRAYRKLTAAAYIFADRRGWQDEPTGTFLRRHAGTDARQFYVIAVPGMLHYLIPAARLIEDDVRLLFIGNGLSRNERRLLGEAFPAAPILHLRTLPGSSWPHGAVLSLLLRTSPRDFGLLDHDFFLFDRSVLRELDFDTDEYAVCLTGWTNKATGLFFPGTHFLFLRVEPIRRLMQAFAVDANVYKRIPARVAAELAALGLSLDNPPKEYQRFFDSFLMLSALARRKGLRARLLRTDGYGFVHVGSTSMGSQRTKPPLLQYASARFAAYLDDEAVRSEYRSRGAAQPADAERLRDLVEPGRRAVIDKLVERIDRTLPGRA